MKKIVLIFLLSVMTLTMQAQTLSKTEKIKTLLEITGSAKLGIQTIERMTEQYKKLVPDVPEEFWDEFVKSVKPDDLVNLIAPSYDKHFSEAEIDQLLAFYKTETGQKYLKEMPQISAECSEAGQIWGRQLGEKVVEKLKKRGYL